MLQLESQFKQVKMGIMVFCHSYLFTSITSAWSKAVMVEHPTFQVKFMN